MTPVVLSHVLDSAAGVYRLLVAEATTVDHEAPPTPEAITAALEAGEEPPGPEMVTETVYVDAEEFVFAADDERWLNGAGERLPDEQVAEMQRGAVRAALKAREEHVDAEVAEHAELPGVGDAL